MFKKYGCRNKILRTFKGDHYRQRTKLVFQKGIKFLLCFSNRNSKVNTREILEEQKLIHIGEGDNESFLFSSMYQNEDNQGNRPRRQNHEIQGRRSYTPIVQRRQQPIYTPRQEAHKNQGLNLKYGNRTADPKFQAQGRQQKSSLSGFTNVTGPNFESIIQKGNDNLTNDGMITQSMNQYQKQSTKFSSDGNSLIFDSLQL